ncbi:MAG: heparan N-sulfatase [Bacteroidetes bacterium GWE2_41_25]|nr:MAG: heparan N-sulfatase [Bacteroidetes bacterium GWA2_40_15]OFX91007.1 MAG: heparan N-sulfatase [Bacteroidetes bacterium GWC2_40_22]OFY13373.1 MAG: heparan N-sulfatase [Bacteroidetes bacterium GWE2_41_25]OFY61961.1 MAG: heparan N-sulfatase [Bacteroidetes bacterium GWF2_41_9]HAM10640.1 heparan N-sulfatase [Bacteroidales bacterium]
MKTVFAKATLIISPWLLTNCQRGSQEKPANDRPNILIVMGDDISYPHMGAYGTSWVKTPGFDRVAANGILFRNAYTPNAKSSPSRACFLTGLNSWQLEEGANHVPFFPSKFKSFMESLSENGYFTGYTAKGWAPGIADDSLGNPRLLTGKEFSSKRLSPPATGISDIDYAGNFEEFLDSRTDNSPFCFWYGSFEPHRGYEYGSGASKGGKSTDEINTVPKFWPDDEKVRNDLLDYAFEIEHFDNHLVKMLEVLEKRGELENTIVIVTADNGMPFPRVKGQAYEYSNHLPLAVMWKKGIKNPEREIYDCISFTDFAPTFLDVAGIKESESGMHAMQGKSFSNIFKSRKKGITDNKRDHVLIGKERHDIGRPGDAGYPIRGIIKEGFLYLRNYQPERWPAGNPETGYLNCDGSPTKSLILNLRRTGISSEYWKLNFGKRVGEELYNIGSDPECLINLANDPGYNTVKRRLNNHLFDELLQQDDPRMNGKGDIFDYYPYADSRTKDFYTRFMRGEISRKAAGWVDSTDFETEGF